jgi:DNA-directed RNA polymerase subunit RPC12/RpoP
VVPVTILRQTAAWALNLALGSLILAAIDGTTTFAWGVAGGPPSSRVYLFSGIVTTLWDGLWFYLICRPASRRVLSSERRNIECPMCGKSFPLPSEWTKPPIRCPSCKEQLQAKVRFAQLPRYLWWIVTPLSLPVFMNYGWLSWALFLLGYLVISVIAGAVAASIFPLDVAQYEPSVTGINLTK